MDPTSPPPEAPPLPSDAAYTELFGDLATGVAALIRHELALAAHEMTEKVRLAGRSVVRVVVGVLVGMVSLLVLAFALVLVAATVMPLWVAALAIAAALGAVGYSLFRRGASTLLSIDLLPTETIASLKVDGALARTEIAATRDHMAGTIAEVRRRLSLDKPTPPRDP